MEKAQFDELSLQLGKLKDSLHAPLRALALVQMASMYYSEHERHNLTREYSQLTARVKEATSVHKKALAGPEQTAAWNELSKLQGQHRAMSDEHPLIAELVRAANSLVGQSYLLNPAFRGSN